MKGYIKTMRVIILVILLPIFLISCGKTTEEKWQEQYDLGMRYLSEGNYEEAVLAFTAAIEIDDKKPDAFVGRGDGYLAIEEFEKALDDYEKAIELGAEDLNEKITNVKGMMEAQRLLAVLYENLSAGNIEDAKQLMKQEDYINMNAMLDDKYVYYGKGDEIRLVVYDDNQYYFGQWMNDKRIGNGLWIKAVFESTSGIESKIYKGKWKNDMPNGDGIITEMYTAKANSSDGDISAEKVEISGNFIDGLCDGTIHETWYMNDGEVLPWMITVKNGVCQPLKNIPEEVKDTEYEDNIAKGQYIISLLDSDELWGSTTDIRGVVGFVGK